MSAGAPTSLSILTPVLAQAGVGATLPVKNKKAVAVFFHLRGFTRVLTLTHIHSLKRFKIVLTVPV
jgi:hypothetical protein